MPHSVSSKLYQLQICDDFVRYLGITLFQSVIFFHWNVHLPKYFHKTCILYVYIGCKILSIFYYHHVHHVRSNGLFIRARPLNNCKSRIFSSHANLLLLHNLVAPFNSFRVVYFACNSMHVPLSLLRYVCVRDLCMQAVEFLSFCVLVRRL